MLERPGDLIPVQTNATSIPWTRRRSQILNFLHRGPVTFSTLVYDTNVGDISALSTYFNPDRISERELNLRFGHYPTSGEKHPSPQKNGIDSVIKPRLLLYPDHNLNPNQVKVQRTLNWVLSHDPSDAAVGSNTATPNAGHQSGNGSLTTCQTASNSRVSADLMPSNKNDKECTKVNTSNNADLPNPLDTSLPPSSSEQPCLNVPKALTVPTSNLSTVLDSMWSDKGVGATDSLDSLWDKEAGDSGLGLGCLANRVSKSNDVLDKIDAGEKWWGAWDAAHSW